MKIGTNMKKNCFCCLHPDACQGFYSQIKPYRLILVFVCKPKKTSFFAKFCLKSLLFHFFQLFFCKIRRKKQILTRVWSAQHPKAGQNIQCFGAGKKYMESSTRVVHRAMSMLIEYGDIMVTVNS